MRLAIFIIAYLAAFAWLISSFNETEVPNLKVIQTKK